MQGASACCAPAHDVGLNVAARLVSPHPTHSLVLCFTQRISRSCQRNRNADTAVQLTLRSTTVAARLHVAVHNKQGSISSPLFLRPPAHLSASGDDITVTLTTMLCRLSCFAFTYAAKGMGTPLPWDACWAAAVQSTPPIMMAAACCMWRCTTSRKQLLSSF